MGSYEFSAPLSAESLMMKRIAFKEAWYKYREFSNVLQLDTYNVMTIMRQLPIEARH